MTKKLVDLSIDEISLVDEPANKAAQVSIIKAGFKACGKCKTPGACSEARKCAAKAFAKAISVIEKASSGEAPDPADFDEALAEIDAERESFERITRLWDVFDALRRSITEIMESGSAETRAADIRRTTMQFLVAVSDFADTLVGTEAGGSPVVTKLALAAGEIMEKAMDIAALEAALAKGVAEIEELKKSLAERDSEISKLKKAAEPKTDDDVLKGLPESVRKRLEAAEALAKASAEQIAKMEDARQEAEAIAKAQTYGIGDAVKVGGIMRRIAKGASTNEDAAEIERILISAGRVAKGSPITKGVGSAGLDKAGSAAEKLNEIATAIAKSEAIDFHKAYAKALDQNKELYAQYLDETREARLRPAA